MEGPELLLVNGNGAAQRSATPQGESAETIALLREAAQCAMLEDLRRRLDASQEERRRIQERLTGC